MADNIRKLYEYKLDNISDIPKAMIEKLVMDSDLFWKLIKYNTFDIDSEPDIPINERLALVEFEATLDNSTKPFKLVPYVNGQILNKETTEVRLYPYDTQFDTNGILIKQYYRINVLTHYNNFLVKGGYRTELIKKELIKVLNLLNYSDVQGIINSFTFDGTSRLQYYKDGFMGFDLMFTGVMK